MSHTEVRLGGATFPGASEPTNHSAIGNNRRWEPCPRLQKTYPPEELVLQCEGRFYARCCTHEEMQCHNYPVVFTDGACMGNGNDDARSGLGIAFGEADYHQASIPVDDMLDRGRRTNQRAECLAAEMGLNMICDHDAEELLKQKEDIKRNRLEDSYRTVIVIATDSEYVVKGLTEWLPKWKERGWRKAGRRRPVNLDLFLKLQAEVEAREHQLGCKIKFWHVKREYNQIADGLAKDAARRATSVVPVV
ncbi:ribonuclease H-like protein [Paxillus ammoniavirescens]|nr:ribonuclease H-like protein [Paxillus ammoniavirescens]